MNALAMSAGAAFLLRITLSLAAPHSPSDNATISALLFFPLLAALISLAYAIRKSRTGHRRAASALYILSLFAGFLAVPASALGLCSVLLINLRL